MVLGQKELQSPLDPVHLPLLETTRSCDGHGRSPRGDRGRIVDDSEHPIRDNHVLRYVVVAIVRDVVESARGVNRCDPG